MILDAHLQFSSAQAITVDAISENVIDLGPLTGGSGTNLIRDIGAGQQVGVLLHVTTSLVSSGSPTLTVTLESDSTANLATSATVHLVLVNAALEAALVAGTIFFGWLPTGAYERYLGLRYTTGVADFDTGDVDAWLTIGDPANWRTYASGFQNNAA
jgi:hypothetical protein